MPSTSTHSGAIKQEVAQVNQESLTEIRTHLNHYMAQMIELMFQSQKENIRFMGQIQASLLKSGKVLSETMSQHSTVNGHVAPQSGVSSKLIQSFIDMNALMLDFAQSTAEQSVDLAKVTLGNHSVNSHGAMPTGKP
jgi:hypothetical protein